MFEPVPERALFLPALVELGRLSIIAPNHIKIRKVKREVLGEVGGKSGVGLFFLKKKKRYVISLLFLIFNSTSLTCVIVHYVFFFRDTLFW